jgi:hypothetical protein
MSDEISLIAEGSRAINDSFFSSIVQRIPGWLNEFTAAALMDILDMQSDQIWEGSLLEIGVYGGRFCAILARDAARRSSHLIGLDPYQHFTIDEVRDRLMDAVRRAPGEIGLRSPRITLVEDISGNWTSDRLLAMLGERSRFVHIDGSHDRENVLWDLGLADSMITPNGVIAVDDWLNPQCVGVMEATFQFFQTKPRASVPFAFVTGKLLLCGRLHAAAYKSRLEAFALSDTVYEQSERYRRRRKVGATWVKQQLMGSEILVLV